MTTITAEQLRAQVSGSSFYAGMRVAALYRGEQASRADLLLEPVRRFGIAEPDFVAVIDGMQMDLDRDVRWPPFVELDLYCDRVASAVGRLSCPVFGMERETGIELETPAVGGEDQQPARRQHPQRLMNEIRVVALDIEHIVCTL